jgi:DNA-binding SARP family transcriptional activator
MVKFGILGPIELRAGERRLPVGGPRQRSLLAFLLLHANRAVSNDQLQEALWGEHGPGGALKPVQMAITRLRRRLEPLDRAAGGGPALQTVSGGYLLTVGAGELDADAFCDGTAQGRAMLDAGDPAGASEVLCEALGLWRGPALAEVAFEDFAQPEITRLEELRLGALETRVEADLALGRHAALIGELQALSVEHPERERICQQLMLALYRCGRHSDALDAYRRVSAYLVGELGLRPGPALRSLQGAVLEHASWLSFDADALSEQRNRRDGDLPRAAAGAPRTPPQQDFALQAELGSGDRASFVGRTAAVEQLERSYEQAVRGTRRIVVLCGEPGIGKTRLATEFALRAHAKGAIVLYGRCDEETLLPHQPFVEALRHYVCNCAPAVLAGQVQLISGELRRVVPDLAERIPELAEPLSGDPEGARYRLFEAVTGLLCEAAQSRPLVLLLDDLHWADKATLLLLKHLARYPREARLMVVGTCREMDVEPDHPLNDVLGDLAREELFERLAPGCLDEGAVSELVGWHTGNRAPPELHRVVFEGTEGNAFFVVEVLRHLAESSSDAAIGDPAMTAAASGRLPLPEGVKDLISRRLARLGPQTSRLLQTASVLGREFGFEMLERVGGLGPDELVDALERAVRAQFIEESADRVGRYAFSHALIRDALYGTLTATRRALLHRRVGAAIEQAHADDLEPHLAELAHHFGHGGSREDLDKAIEYAGRAAERAVALLAYEQAVGHHRDAIELLVPTLDAPERRVQHCDMTIARGEAERKAGDPAYRRTLLQGARIAQELGDVERLARAALANNRGFQSSSQGVDHERVAVLQAALSALGEDDGATRAGLLAQLAVEFISDADWRRRAKLSDEALAIARRIGDPATLARVLTQRSLAQRNPRTLAARNEDLLEAWQLADRIGERQLAAHAAAFGAHAALAAGDLERADRLLESLGTLVEQLGQPIVEWYGAIVRAKRCVLVCSPQEAERLAFDAYEIGQRAAQPDALVWFLAQVFAARFLQGTLDADEPHLPTLFAKPGSAPVVGPEFSPSRSIPLLFGAAMSAIFCEVGRLDDGRRHFELLMDELTDPPNDYSTLPILAHAAIACAHLGDVRRAEQLYALLEPYDEQFVDTGASWFGAVVHHLALLSATMGRLGDADAHFAAAGRAYERLSARAWLARCRLDWAGALLAGRGGDELERADVLLGQVLATARELGLSAIEERARALRERAPLPSR